MKGYMRTYYGVLWIGTHVIVVNSQATLLLSLAVSYIEHWEALSIYGHDSNLLLIAYSADCRNDHVIRRIVVLEEVTQYKWLVKYIYMICIRRTMKAHAPLPDVKILIRSDTAGSWSRIVPFRMFLVVIQVVVPSITSSLTLTMPKGTGVGYIAIPSPFPRPI